MRYILALIIAVPLLAVSLEADAGLVEDLRSGKSDVKTVPGSVNRIVGPAKAFRTLKSKPDFKAMVVANTSGYGSYYNWSASSAEDAIHRAMAYCQSESFGCGVYAVGDQVVMGDSQAELADAIEAYNLKVSGNTKKETPANDTSSEAETEAEPIDEDDPLEAKLEKLNKLLEKGLITEEEAAAKRAKLLEDL